MKIRVGIPMRALSIALLAFGTAAGGQDKRQIVVTSAFGEDKTSQFSFDPSKGLKMADAFDVPEYIACEKLVSIRLPGGAATGPSPIQLTLINGDVLYGKITADSSSAVVLEGMAGNLSIRLDHIRQVSHIKLRPARAPGKIDLSRGDVVRQTNGDEDVGRLLKIGPESVTFRSKLVQGERTIPLSDIVDVLLQPAERYRPLQTPNTVEVSLADGSIVKGELLELAADRVKLKGELDSLGSPVLTKVSLINFRNGAAIYLSDLEPTAVKERSYLSSLPSFPYRKDRAAGPEERSLSVGGQKYAKGLGVHAISELTYSLDDKYRYFSAVAGLDDSSEDKGSVMFVVLADGKELYKSPLVAGRQWAKALGGDPAPRPIRLEVKGVATLTLRVECGPDDDVRDRAAWADAKLIR